MNFTLAKYHYPLFAILLLAITATLILSFTLGDLKTFTDFDWFDLIGEGGITLMTLIWIFFILISRPAGKVTNLLFMGLILTHLSMLLDVLDEFVVYPEHSRWVTTIESLPAPIGMLIMSIGLYHWHQEQMALNKQLFRTERYYREYQLTDDVTGLYTAEYMKQQLNLEIEQQKQNVPFSVMMLDIRHFEVFNQSYGDEHGDNLLREVAQLIRMNIRNTDLACRYASDRFIVLMPEIDLASAEIIGNDIKESINHLAYKVGDTVTAIHHEILFCANEYQAPCQYEDILSELNEKMLTTKILVNAA